MALFTAVQAGLMDDGATFGNDSPGTIGVDFPDNDGTASVDLAGYELSQGTVWMLDALSDSVGGGKLTITAFDGLSCGTITNAKLYIDSDCSFSFISGTISYSGSGYAIEITSNGLLGDFNGSLVCSGTGCGIYNSGTLSEISGTVENTSSGCGVYNNGNFTFSSTGSITNSGSGDGIHLESGSVTTLSSLIYNTGPGKGINLVGGTLDIIGGTITTSDGYGLYISEGATVNSISSATFYAGGDSYGIYSGYSNTAINFTNCYGNYLGLTSVGANYDIGIGGLVVGEQPDLIEENIAIGATILEVEGTKGGGGGETSHTFS